MMHMSFWFGYDIGDFFFKGLTINSSGKLVALCIVLTILSVLYEAMKVHKSKAKSKAAREQQRSPSSQAPSESPLLHVEPPSISREQHIIKFLKAIEDAAFFLLHNALGYALMLSVMIYNGYIFIAVVGGMTIGYLIFGHMSMRINMENVRAVQSRVICNAQTQDTAIFKDVALFLSQTTASLASTLPSISEQPSTAGEGTSRLIH